MNLKMSVPALIKRLTKYSDKYCAPIIYKAVTMPSVTPQNMLQPDPSQSSTKGLGSLVKSPLTESYAMLFQFSAEKGMKEDPGNHSPVSLTSVPEKIMKIMQGATERH